MATPKKLLPRTFTIEGTDTAAKLDTAILNQITTVAGNYAASALIPASGTGTVLPGSITVVQFMLAEIAGPLLSYTAQVQWQEWI